MSVIRNVEYRKETKSTIQKGERRIRQTSFIVKVLLAVSNDTRSRLDETRPESQRLQGIKTKNTGREKGCHYVIQWWIPIEINRYRPILEINRTAQTRSNQKISSSSWDILNRRSCASTCAAPEIHRNPVSVRDSFSTSQRRLRLSDRHIRPSAIRSSGAGRLRG